MSWRERDRKGRGPGNGRKREWKPQQSPTERNAEVDRVDRLYGYEKIDKTGVSHEHEGWMTNMRTIVLEDEETGAQRNAVEYYFLAADGTNFKATQSAQPYFYIAVRDGCERDVSTALKRKFPGQLMDVVTCAKEDLSLANHLSGLQKTYLQLRFDSTSNLMEVRKHLKPIVERNYARSRSDSLSHPQARTAVRTPARSPHPPRASRARPTALLHLTRDEQGGTREGESWQDGVEEMREYDVPYHHRVAIDSGRRVGKWYKVKEEGGRTSMEVSEGRKAFGEPRVLAYDIECVKQPLKFPDATSDPVMMISYMMDGQV